MSMTTLSRRSRTQVERKRIRGVPPSQRVNLMSCFANTASGKPIILRNFGNCRTTRRETTRQSLRVKLVAVPVASDNSSANVMFILPLLDVLLMNPFRYLILPIHIMSTLIEICLLLMNWCKMEVLFGWAIILLVNLLV
jgi:hypothetical protein